MQNLTDVLGEPQSLESPRVLRFLTHSKLASPV